MRWKVTAAVCSDKGCVRGNNEDSFYLNGQYMPREKMDNGGLFRGDSAESRQLYAVCDGMGGQARGEEASFSAVSRLDELRNFLFRGGDVSEGIKDYVRRANEAVLAVDESHNAGTTLVLLYLDGHVATVAHIGDSRAYLYRDRKLTRLTEDQSEAQRLINIGVLTPETVKSHPARHALTRYLGFPAGGDYVLNATISQHPLRRGDVFILCSDGLTDMLEDDEIAIMLDREPAEASEMLVCAAKAGGGRDNVTALVVKAIRSGFTLLHRRPRFGPGG